ncbi:MAG: thiamine pyrophosphate-binding protein, partial [Mesorhizobium sp.]
MTRNGGRLLVECLVALGASKSFGVPGESYLAVLDALHDTRGRLDYVLCRNEGGAAFMASAYGKLTGSPGICFVTRGPGATNASIGVHTAMQDSSPMILFVGQVGADMKGREAFQEVDYRAVFGSLAKWAVEIDDVGRIPEIVARAWTTALTGRPGPVVVALPEDMLTEPTHIVEAAPAPEAIASVRSVMADAQRPVLLVGGANWTTHGRAALQAFAEESDIPVVAAFRYQDQFDNGSPVFVGEAGVGMVPHVKALIRDADVILAVNVRFGEMTTDGYTLLSVPTPRQKLIHVHASDREIGKVYVPLLGIHAGPNAFAAALPSVKGHWASWRAKARQAYEGAFDAPVQPGSVDMVAVSAWLRD